MDRCKPHKPGAQQGNIPRSAELPRLTDLLRELHRGPIFPSWEKKASGDDKSLNVDTQSADTKPEVEVIENMTTAAKNPVPMTSETEAGEPKIDTKSVDTESADTKSDTKSIDNDDSNKTLVVVDPENESSAAEFDAESPDQETGESKTSETESSSNENADSKPFDAVTPINKADENKTSDTKAVDTKAGDNKPGNNEAAPIKASFDDWSDSHKLAKALYKAFKIPINHRAKNPDNDEEAVGTKTSSDTNTDDGKATWVEYVPDPLANIIPEKHVCEKHVPEKHRRINGLKLKAKNAPSTSNGLRRFALRANHLANAAHTLPEGYMVAGICPFISKRRPHIAMSNHLQEWRGFELERTHSGTHSSMMALESQSIPFTDMPSFLGLVHEANAGDSSSGTIQSDRYLIFRHITRSILAHRIDPSRQSGQIPKSARLTHFYPSNILIIKLPRDVASPAAVLDFLSKPIIGWAYSMDLSRNLKLCGGTRYTASLPDSCAEGLDGDAPRQEMEEVERMNPGVVLNGFASFSEADMAFRPFRIRPYQFDAPSVVIESNYGGGEDYTMLRYKACWWLQLMTRAPGNGVDDDDESSGGGVEDGVQVVLLVNVNSLSQEITIEVWRNMEEEVVFEGQPVDPKPVPTRVQKVVVRKRDEFKGAAEEANPAHYWVEGGPLAIAFRDVFLEEPNSWGIRETFGHEEGQHCDFELEDAWLRAEAADLWYADGQLVNDWAEGQPAPVRARVGVPLGARVERD